MSILTNFQTILHIQLTILIFLKVQPDHIIQLGLIQSSMNIATKAFLSCFMVTGVMCASRKQEEMSYVSTLQYRANQKIEDRLCYGKLKKIKGLYAAVFDGHGGDLVADYAAGNLDQYLNMRINKNLKFSKKMSENIEKSLDQAFDDIENGFKAIFMKNLENVDYQRVGACALATVITADTLTVANSGDCQGLLLGNDAPVKINTRHNAGQHSEKIRLKRQFPNQKDIYKCIKNTDYCYVKGRLQPTRSFGDFYLKSPEYNFTKLSVFTGPYITHKPEIKTFSILDNGFRELVLATDGLWDQLNESEVNQIYKKVIDERSLSLHLFEGAKKKIMKRNKIKQEKLQKLENRRDLHDDISIITINLKQLQMQMKQR